MRKIAVSQSALSLVMALGVTAMFFVACGDETTQINQTGLEVADSVDDLSKCTKDREGEQAFVKDENAARICIDGDWVPMVGDYSCKTVELKDGSGLKIVCNGDSIGVLLNGSDGKDGKSGKDGKDGEDGADGEDGKDAVIPQDTLENDSERVAISLDSLVGYTQKGPFLKGSTVYLYELSDGRTLKQTNGNFTSNIVRDDGRYKFNARDLVSQYAMIVVDGYYRNEVTGVSSNAPIRLKAITDMRKHNSVNVNILTHLEFERVYYLVTREQKTVKAAKSQAQKEILKIFDIELAEGADAEDMDVFGSSDADAALLAVSIMLQGDRTASELMALLSEISNAIVENGEWTGARADSIKAGIADWIMSNDSVDKLDSIRKYVEGWHLSDEKIPAFENIVRKFASKELRLGLCDGRDETVGTVRHVKNPKSRFYVESYEDTTGVGNKLRLTCVDAETIRWSPSTDLEKDRFDWETPIDTSGVLLTGRVTKKNMVWDDDTLRYADSIEVVGGKGCVSYGRDSVYILEHQYSYYRCKELGWEWTLDTLNRDTLFDERDGKTYKTIGIKTQMWMAENLNFEIMDTTSSGRDYRGNSYCFNNEPDSCVKHGRLYTWFAAKNTEVFESRYGTIIELVTKHDICPTGWHLPSKEEWETVFSVIGRDSYRYGFGIDYGAGERLPNGTYNEISFGAEFWSSTIDNVNAAYILDYSDIINNDPRVQSEPYHLVSYNIKYALPVRCVKDKPQD